MWYGHTFVKDPTALEQFEERFRFTMPEQFKDFLFENNAARASDISVTTSVAVRPVTALLDFNTEDHSSTPTSAWAVNKRLRSILGPKRVAFACSNSHYLCMERQYRQRCLVVWNYMTQRFEPVQISVDEFLERFGAA